VVAITAWERETRILIIRMALRVSFICSADVSETQWLSRLSFAPHVRGPPPQRRRRLAQRKSGAVHSDSAAYFYQVVKDLALCGFRNFRCKVFFFFLDAFAHFKANKTRDVHTSFLGGFRNGQVRIDHK